MELNKTIDITSSQKESIFEPDFRRTDLINSAQSLDTRSFLAGTKTLPEISLAQNDATQFISTIDEETKQIAESGSTVYATDGTEVIAKAGSIVYAEKGSKVTAEKGADVFAKSGSLVYANDTSVNAPDGPTIHQEPGADVYVQSGKKAVAYKDSVVETKYGSIEAHDGSTIFALVQRSPSGKVYDPPQIHVKGTCTVYAMKGSLVDAEKGSKVTIKNWDGLTYPPK